MHQRKSQQRVRPGGPPPKVINLPLQQEVKLHQTKNAWKPGITKKKDQTAAEELDELQVCCFFRMGSHAHRLLYVFVCIHIQACAALLACAGRHVHMHELAHTSNRTSDEVVPVR